MAANIVAALLGVLALLIASGAASVSAEVGLLEGSSLTSRKLLQTSVVNVIIPVYQDQAPCATLNADDASPLLDKQNSTLGWATVQQGSVNITNGLTTLQVDLTAHVGDFYLADSSSTQPDAANVRACILTEAPTSCPVTSQLMYHMGMNADCNKRRATVEVPIPLHVFSCNYNSTNFTTTFYVQLEVDLASYQCTAPEGTFYAGSRSKAVRGCSYITVVATCSPQTCDPPASLAAADDTTASTTPASSPTKKLLPIVVGVGVGSGVLILAILASFVYLRSRWRDGALHRKYSDGGLDFGDEPLTTDDESSYELDFSGRSTTVLGGQAASGGGASASATGRGSAFLGRASMLFSRTPRSAAAARYSVAAAGGGIGGAFSGGSVAGMGLGMGPETAPSSAVFASGWQPLPSPMGGGPAASPFSTAVQVNPGEMLRQQGAARFSEKYKDQQALAPASAAAAAGAGASAEGASVRGGAGASSAAAMGHGISYQNPAFGIARGEGSVHGGSTIAASNTDIISEAQIELLDDGYNANYRLSRLSSKLGPQGAAATPASLRGRSALLPRPAPAATPSTGRSGDAAVGYGASPRFFAGGAAGSGAISLGGSGGGAAAAAGDLSDPQAVPEDANAFINPLAMLGESSEDDSSVAEGEYASRAMRGAVLSRRSGGIGVSGGGAGSGGGAAASSGGGIYAAAFASAGLGLGGGGLPQRVPWPVGGLGSARDAQALQQQRPQSQQSMGYGAAANANTDDEELLTSARRQRSVVYSAAYSATSMHAAGQLSNVEAPATGAAGHGSAGAGTLVIPTLSAPAAPSPAAAREPAAPSAFKPSATDAP